MQTTGLKGARLSLQQERLWSLQRESKTYRVQCAVLLQGRLDVALFQQALRQMVEQHEILHTLFYSLPGMDIPVQVIGHHPEVFCPTVDLEDICASMQKTLLDTHFALLQGEPFDLAHGSLLRTVLFRQSPETHLLLVSVSALCADAATLSLIIVELSRRYEAYLQGRVLAEEPLQYTAISAWHNNLLVSESAKTPREFWSRIDISRLTLMHLPFEREDRTLKATQSVVFEPHTLAVTMEEGWSTYIAALAHRYGVSVAALLLACWYIALWRLTDDPDLVVGVACDGRIYEELTDALGLYSRFVPVSSYFETRWTFEQVVSSVSLALREAMKWQAYFTWKSMRNATDDGVSAGYFPLAFGYDCWPATMTVEELTISLARFSSCTEPFVLKLSALQVGERLQLELHYDLQCVTPQQACRLVSVLHTLLQSVLEQPGTPIATLRILALAEQEQLLTAFRASATLLPVQGLYQLFEKQVVRMPGQLAVVSAEEQLTYQELNGRANQLASILRRRGVGPNVLVGLYVQRSIQMIVGVLAILKAGGAYVPLDPESPPARLVYQLQDVQALLLLTQKELLPRMPHWGGTTLCLEAMREEMRQEPETNLPALSGPDDLAYVIYTSGTTGVPKGVMIRQQSVVNYTLALCELVAQEPGLQFATVSTLAADLGNTAIFCALASGGCLQVLDYETITSGEAFEHWVEQHPIDVLKIVPSHLSALLAGDRQANLILPHRALILGGEVLPSSLLKRLRELRSSCRVLNHYGPTETTIGVLVNVLGKLDVTEVPTEYEERSGTVSLGRPISNIEVYVLDPWQQVVPVGVTGELYVGGVGLAMGYLHQPEQTAERFVPHPFCGQAGARLYRTGDLARYTAQGQIEFVGRRDSQVKLRGYRIELGEIEAVLLRHPNVRGGVVVLREDEPEQPQLVAYVIPRYQPAPSLFELHDFLQGQLPIYMLPSAVVSLNALPLTVNGKLDRRALLPPLHERENCTAYAPPRSPLEEALAGIWEEVLKVKPVGIHNNFFHLGGHSLLVTQIISRLRSNFQIELPVRCLFDAPTVAGLAEQVEQALRHEQRIELPPLISVPRSGELPLSFAQQRLWFLDQLAPGDTSYNVPHALHIQGVLNVHALDRTLTEVVRRHENLRTTFPTLEGRPIQIILPPTSFGLQFCELSGLSPEEGKAQAHLLAGQEAQQPFELAQGPLLRVTLLRRSQQEHVLLLTMHHIISDAWSRTVLTRELNTLYAAFVEGKLSPLPELPIQYVDFASWQRNCLQGEVRNVQLNYWIMQLEGATPLELLTDRPRPNIQRSHGATHTIVLPSSLSDALIDLSHREGTTLFMTLLAAFQILLARYTAQDDIPVGIPIANRNHAEIENLIGFFTNTLVMRTDLSGNPTFQEALARVRNVALGAYAHQDLPFEHLVEVLQPERDLSRSPLFQVMFVLQHVQHTAVTSLKLEGASLWSMAQTQTTAKFDLTLFTTSAPQGLYCTVEYNSDLFEASTIARLLEHWHLLLETMVAHPEYPIASFPFLTSAERQLMLQEWNNTEMDISQDVGIQALFESQTVRTPDTIAVVDEHQTLSYAYLNQLSNQLARCLHSWGVGPDVIVGLCLERSLTMIVAVLGILKAGGAYLPLDPAYPSERLTFMLHDAHAPILLTQEHLLASLALTTQQVQVFLLDTLWPLIAREPQNNLPSVTYSDHLAYVIYTSGSTGQPKGVAMPHRPLFNLFQWQRQHSLAAQGTRTLQFSSLSFDVACQELFSTWSSGGTLHVISDTLRKDAFALAQFLQSTSIQRLFLPFIALQQLVLAFENTEALPSSLSEVITAGEQLQITSAILHFFTELTGATLFNQYGPSESHVVTAFALNPPPMDWSPLPPIGTPIANTQIYLLNEQFQPVPVGAVGELCISGGCLARGYLHCSDSTADKFRPNPWGSKPGSRIYRTGDMACYRLDGTIMFLGRRDHQVKVRGYRIELGEIEVVLSRHPSVRENVVTVQEGISGEKKLIAYVVANDGTKLTSGEIRSFLAGFLPEAMIPSHFVLLETLPLTPSGKVDRRALPKVNYKHEQQAYVRPRDVLEAQLLLIWQEVLQVENLGITDNFFDLGGYSILAVRLMSRIQKLLGRDLALSTVFQFPTIVEMAVILRREAKAHDESTLVPIQPLGSQRPPFFCIHPVGGTIFRYYTLAHLLGTDQPFYGLQTPDLDGQGNTYSTVEELAACYITAMQTVQPQGPYLLGGWSMGGVVAFEMAQQLQRQGHKVALLALLDSVVENFLDTPIVPVEKLDTSDLALTRVIIGHYGIPVPGEDFYQREPQEQFRYVVEQLKLAGIMTDDTGIEQARRIMRVNMANLHAFQTYRPQVYPHRLTLFRAKDGVEDAQPGQDNIHRGRTFSRGWDTLTMEGLDIHVVPGNHSTMLDEPQVQVLTSLLRNCLDEICASHV